jgi:putative hemolysin
LDLADTTVEEIMTPRIKIDKLSDETTVKEALEYTLNHTHSRIPVYHEDIDHIIGIVNMRLLLDEINK